MSDRPPAPDLNLVRELFYRAQRSNELYPSDPADQVTVGKDAVIRVGVAAGDDPSLSKVQQGTFAATRSEVEATTVRQKLPNNTARLTVDGVDGWAYSFLTEFQDRFELFAYFDGVDYQVMLIAPELEGRVNPHDAHLFTGGRLCLSSNPASQSGQPTLEEAYSKSVLWANGMSLYLQGHTFPWSINNL
jgi:hypothetical protein